MRTGRKVVFRLIIDVVGNGAGFAGMTLFSAGFLAALFLLVGFQINRDGAGGRQRGGVFIRIADDALISQIKNKMRGFV